MTLRPWLSHDRRSWAIPPAHGTYQGFDLELLDPADEDERALLIEARHPEFAAALQGEEDVIVDGEAVNPRRCGDTPARRHVRASSVGGGHG